METREQVTLARDVEAALVPVGDRVALKAGERAVITQALGGSYTVVVGGNMYRIDGKDADALGKQPLAQQGKQAASAATRDAVEEQVWEALRTCYDPEIPVNIVELGLIYGCELQPVDDPRGWRVQLQMTLTAPGCGMGDYLSREVEQKLLAIPGVEQVDVELVWDPPWSRERMSEAARLELGVF
ncbi:MAG: putative Fe-S cluster assembly protein SufT [Betaproteobacteria bacterium]|nr:putative Fe-S cluster assembly protein SufT [Betaproteobacteria bacterium]